MFKIKEILGFCDKYKLTIEELFFLRLLLLLQEDTENKFYMSEFIRVFNLSQESLKNIVFNLQSKGVLIKKKDISSIYDLEVNKIFKKAFHKCAFDLGQELWEEYPINGEINGSLIPLKTIAKKFDSPEDFFRYYGKSISWNENKHNEIIGLIKWAKDKDIINQSLGSFVINRSWEYLDAIKNKNLGNINYDTVRLL